MGASEFFQNSKGKTAEKAFKAAVEQAEYYHGHAGYSGTMAEKNSFVMIDLPEGKEALRYAKELVGKGDERIDDKWGPAGCIKTGKDSFLFFGWASC